MNLPIFHIIERHVCDEQQTEDTQIEECSHKNSQNDIARMKCRNIIMLMRKFPDGAECIGMHVHKYYNINCLFYQCACDVRITSRTRSILSCTSSSNPLPVGS